MGFFLAFTFGLSFSVFLTHRITVINGSEIKIVFGPDIKVETGGALIKDTAAALKKLTIESSLATLMAKATDVETSYMKVNREALAAKEAQIQAEIALLKNEIENFGVTVAISGDVTM